MKRFFMIMVAVLCGFAAMAQSPGTLSCGDVTAVAGGEAAYLEVKLTAEDVTALSGIQFSFTLPEGVSIAQFENEDEEMEDDVTFPIAKSRHQVGIKAAAGGGYLVYLGGETSLSFKTTTDVVAKIGIAVAKTMKNGTYDINFVKAVVSDKSSPVQSYDVPNFTAKLTVTGGSEVELPVCTLSANDIQAVAGGETAYLEVKLATEDVTALSGIQFNFTLPEGVTIAQYKNEDEEMEDDVTFPIAKSGHQVGIKAASGGGYLVYLGGETSLSFKTSTDVVARIGLKVAKTVTDGTYNINFVKAIVSDKSNPVQSYDVADFSAKLTVTGGGGTEQPVCTISANDIEAVAGGETAYLEVKLATEDVTALSGIQFNFTLPEGVTIAQYKNEDEEMEDDVTFPIAKSGHQVGIKAASGGGYLVYLGGETSLSFKTSTDVVARIGLKVAKTVTDGTYNINFVKAIVSDKSNPVQSYDVADFSAKLTVTGGGGTEQPVCTISANDIEAVAGGETAYLEVKLATEDVTALSGIQFNFTLPEGVTIAQYKNEDEEMEDDVTFPIAKSGHQVGIKAASGGGYLVYLGGETSLSFKTSTDVVARIGLKVAKTVTDGTYNINFVKAIVSDKSTPVQSYDVPDFSAKLTVTAAEPDDDTDISKLDNVIYLEKMEGFLGSSATLSFKMKNTADIRGFQFDLYLPEGVTPVVKNNRIQAKLSSGRLPEDDEHKLALQEQEDGSIRILCNSEYDETFTGNSGEIFTMTVNVAEDMAEGNYPIVMKQMRLSETDIDHYYDTNRVQSTITIMAFMLGDINGDGVVNVSDYIGVANHIMGNTPTSFNISAADVNRDGIVNVSDYIGIANIILTGNPYGNTNNAKPAYQKANVTDVSTMENVIYVPSQEVTAGMQSTLSFHMKNTAEIRGFQFDLYLPEGFTVVKNAKGRIQGALSSGRLPEDDEHTLTIQEQADGAIRFLCGSQYDETFTGNDGEIITLQINVPEDMKNGDYPVALKTMRLSETDISKYYDTDLVETTVTVVGGVGIADILEDSNTPAVIYNLSGQRLAKPQHGLNIVNGKKIIIK